MRAVAERLNLLNPQARVVTVAGTNGKGSCVRALEAMLIASGTEVGCYTSPHILTYNERVRVNGGNASDAQLLAAFGAIDAARGDITLTYFEFGTLAALYCFAQARCSVWVLEVGLGGRLDATNIIDTHIAVITSIGLDHCEWLGDTREAIGFEKAGICRAGVPLVCADADPPASIAAKADELNCPSYWLGKEFGFKSGAAEVTFFGPAGRAQVTTSLAYPSVAAALTVMSLLQLGSLAVWQQALAQAALPGRAQAVVRAGQTWVLDVAHNPAAFEFLWRKLTELYPAARWTLVLAMMKDKDVAACIAQCAPYVQQWWVAPLSDNPRALAPAELQARILAGVPNAQVQPAASIAEALQQAQHGAPGPILVAGSFFTVAEASLWLNEAPPGCDAN